MHAAVILLLAACRPMGVAFGPPAALPVVSAPTDPRRLYVRDDDGNLWFFDTGYAHTTCDDDLVLALGLTPHGHVPIRGASGRTSASRTRLERLGLGGHTLTGVRCMVRDLRTTSSISDEVAGVIGMDVVRRFRFGLDAGSRTVTLADPDAAPPLADAVRFRRARGHGYGILLPLLLDGHRRNALVDTGATATCIDARRLPFEVQEVGRVRVLGSGGDGERIVATWTVDAASLAGHPLPGLTAVSLEHVWHAPDLLGLDVLSAFRFTWDFERREVAVEPR